MNTKLTYFILFSLLILSVGISTLVAPLLPEEIATHWNAHGEPDDYMPKSVGMLFFPLTLLIFIVLYVAIPFLDPLKKNIEGFRPTYNFLWTLLSVFLFYIFSLSLAWNLGYRFNFTFFILPAIAILWYGLGTLLAKAERNWFVGIRTPWTLSSDVVWRKTHKLSGQLFKIAGVVTLFGLLLPNPDSAFLFAIIPVVSIAFFAVVYSFIEFKKEEGEKK